MALCLQARLAQWVMYSGSGALTCRVAFPPQKDPKKRPTALALQQHKFVLTAKKPVRV